MRHVIRSKLEMAARVREFSRAHVSTEPGYAPVLARLEDSITRAVAIDARQQEGFKAVRGARNRRKELRRVIHSQLVRYVVALGALAMKGQADIVGRFKIPDGHAPNAAFITAVKGLIGDAEQHKEELVALGMSPVLLDELTAMVSDFEMSAESVRTARRDHIGAREDLEAVALSLMEVVAVIEGITRYRFGDNREVMAEWRAARQIPGQSRGGSKPEQPVDIRPAA